jgi:hypothetical protein
MVDNMLLGMISREDIVRALRRASAGEKARGLERLEG